MLLKLFQKTSALPRKSPLQGWRLYSVKVVDDSQSVPKSKNDLSSKDEPVDMENPFKQMNPICTLCGIHIDYKNSQLLSQFTSTFTGLLMPNENLNLCEKKYAELKTAVERAQVAGFLPVLMKEPVFFDDPYLAKKDRPSEGL